MQIFSITIYSKIEVSEFFFMIKFSTGKICSLIFILLIFQLRKKADF